MPGDLEFRLARENDVPWLARMNQQLICDEGHRNRMFLSRLERRMADFLRCEYEAVIVSTEQKDIGYALYRKDPEWLYLRQIFVIAELRRKGVGREIIEWLKDNPGKNSRIVRTDVLVNNPVGIDFWKALGFKEYCITMELEKQ